MFSKLKDAWALMSMFLGLAPMIRELISAIEVPGHGPEKLKVVVDLAKAAYEMVPGEFKVLISLDKVEAYVVTIVNILVPYFNAVGLFTKKQ